MKRLVLIDLDDAHWNALFATAADADPRKTVPEIDLLVSSMLKSMIDDDIAEEKKRSAV